MRNGPDSVPKDPTSPETESGRSPPLDRAEPITNLTDIAARISRRELPHEDFSEWVLHPWIDLARLALVAQQGELHANCECVLTHEAVGHLREVLGERPADYYGDLLHCARVLRVLRREDDGQWNVVCQDSELLGATQRETFPAMCAAWLKEPPPIKNAAVVAPDNVHLRLDFLRLLHLLEPESWYPYEVLGVLLQGASARQSIGVGDLDEVDCREIAERILLPMGAVVLNREQDHFSLYDGLQIPPLPEACTPGAGDRVRAFRKTVRENIADSNRWRRVATGLIRCIETRRTRSASARSLRCLDAAGQRLETGPQLPFKDCLFVARLGRLTPLHPARGAQEASGHFVFELDGELIRRRVREGLPVETIAAFLAERCEEDSYRRFRTLLEQALPDAKI